MKLMNWVIAIYGVILTAGLAFVILHTPAGYLPGAHNYKIMVEGKEASSLRADRIERQDGCVIFWRGSRIDTILCAPGMSGVIVTEVVE